MPPALWNLLLLLGWGLLFWPSLRWLLGEAPTSPHHLWGTHHLNLMILLGGLFVGLYKLRQNTWALKAAPRAAPLPLAVMLSSMLGFLLIERFWDISLLSALCLFVGSYGLIGLFVSEASWRRNLPLALLLTLALPFGDRAQAYLGLPARMLAAQVVHKTLAGLDIATLQTQSIILLENGIASVDAPCSGLRSLWTGSMFLMGATALERRTLDLRWLLSGLLLLGALLVANTARVAMIVLVGIVWAQPKIAEVIHEPLGITGFVLSCALCYALLKRWRPAPKAPKPAPPPAARASSPHLAPLLCGLCLLGAALHSPRPKPMGTGRAFSARLPERLHPEPLSMSAAELDLIQRFGAGQAIKRRFSHEGLRGSVLISYSPSWRAHHPPELCLTSLGVRVKALHEHALGPGLGARRLELSDGRTAFYWYQSPERTTPDMLTRITSELIGAQRRWVLVSMVLDDQPGDEASLSSLLDMIHGAVARALEEL